MGVTHSLPAPAAGQQQRGRGHQPRPSSTAHLPSLAVPLAPEHAETVENHQDDVQELVSNWEAAWFYGELLCAAPNHLTPTSAFDKWPPEARAARQVVVTPGRKTCPARVTTGAGSALVPATAAQQPDNSSAAAGAAAAAAVPAAPCEHVQLQQQTAPATAARQPDAADAPVEEAVMPLLQAADTSAGQQSDAAAAPPASSNVPSLVVLATLQLVVNQRYAPPSCPARPRVSARSSAASSSSCSSAGGSILRTSTTSAGSDSEFGSASISTPASSHNSTPRCSTEALTIGSSSSSSSSSSTLRSLLLASLTTRAPAPAAEVTPTAAAAARLEALAKPEQADNVRDSTDSSASLSTDSSKHGGSAPAPKHGGSAPAGWAPALPAVRAAAALQAARAARSSYSWTRSSASAAVAAAPAAASADQTARGTAVTAAPGASSQGSSRPTTTGAGVPARQAATSTPASAAGSEAADSEAADSKVAGSKAASSADEPAAAAAHESKPISSARNSTAAAPESKEPSNGSAAAAGVSETQAAGGAAVIAAGVSENSPAPAAPAANVPQGGTAPVSPERTTTFQAIAPVRIPAAVTPSRQPKTSKASRTKTKAAITTNYTEPPRKTTPTNSLASQTAAWGDKALAGKAPAAPTKPAGSGPHSPSSSKASSAVAAASKGSSSERKASSSSNAAGKPASKKGKSGKGRPQWRGLDTISGSSKTASTPSAVNSSRTSGRSSGSTAHAPRGTISVLQTAARPAEAKVLPAVSPAAQASKGSRPAQAAAASSVAASSAGSSSSTKTSASAHGAASSSNAWGSTSSKVRAAAAGSSAWSTSSSSLKASAAATSSHSYKAAAGASSSNAFTRASMGQGRAHANCPWPGSAASGQDPWGDSGASSSIKASSYKGTAGRAGSSALRAMQLQAQAAQVMQLHRHASATTTCGTVTQQAWPLKDKQPSPLPAGCVGLRNAGNTCYANSVLQCLNAWPELLGAVVGSSQAQALLERASAQLADQAGSGGSSCGGGGMAPLWRDSAPVTSALAALLQDVWGAGGGLQQQQAARVVDPDLLITALARADDRWGDGTQQDCQELLLSLLALLQDEGNRVRRKPNRPKQRDTMGDEALLAAAAAADDAAWCSSAAGDVLGGQLQSTVTCGHCGCRSHTFEAVNGSLLLPLPKQQQQQAWQQQQQAWQPAAARRRGGGKQPLAAVLPVQRPVTVAGLLQAFCAGEVLRGEEAYRCGQCGAVTEASKRLQLYVEQPSPLLALAAKRFDSGQEPGSAGGGSKVSTPLLMDASAHVLDLTPFCNPAGLAAAAARGLPRPVYELVAVADHAGSLGRGHYTARVRSPVDGRWRAFNDEAVTLLEGAPSGCDSAPYMLFYRLRQQ